MRNGGRIAIVLERDARGPLPIAYELYGLAHSLGAPEDIVALMVNTDAPFPAAAYAANAFAALRKMDAVLLLIGATHFGRQLAPYLAVRFETGLSADCTDFCWTAEGRLRQIRPAFDGAALAWVFTESACPRIATVRPGAFNPKELPESLMRMALRPEKLPGLTFQARRPLESSGNISNAKRIIAIGGGIRRREDVAMFERLADRLDAALACSRVLSERGWMPQARQIGLSGHMVRPELLVTFGISGSAQFLAGIRHAPYIIAVNSNPHASIFAHAQQAILGDLYQIIPHIEALTR